MIRINSGSRGAWSGVLAGSLLAAAMALVPSPLAAQSTRLNGDVNADAAVDQVDAQAVLQGIVEIGLPSGQDLTFGDANCDGRVTAIDAQIILMKAAQIDVAALCVGRAVGAPVATIIANPATGSIVVKGFPLQLTATTLDPSNTPLTFRTIVWTSSDVSKATVTQAGLVEGIAPGAVEISATNGSVTTIIPITVVAAGPTTLTVSPSAGLVDVNRTMPLVPELRDAANNVLPERVLVWKSSNPAIAAVNASTGLVTGVKPGTVTITADAGNGITGTASINVLSTGAVTRHWKGATSADWSDATNWTEGVVPVPTDTVEVPAGTPNAPSLPGRTIIAGVKVLKGATLAIGPHELQITGRLEVDGQITGTGVVITEGLNHSTTYVRGTVPNLIVTGQTELVDNTTVTGSLEINAVSQLRLRGRKLDVAQNLTVRGGIRMNEKTDTLDVRGNARFVNDQGGENVPLRSVWSTGTFRLGGNLVLFAPAGAPSITPLEASGTNRIILNGSAAQVVADTGVALVLLNELDISTAAVEFRSHTWNSTTDQNRFRFAGRVIATIASTISGNGRVNAMANLTTAGGSVTLLNLGVRGLLVASGAFKPDTVTFLGPVATTNGPQLIPAGAAYQYQNVVVAGIDRFAPGSTGVPNDLILGCLTSLSDCVMGTAALTIGGNSVTIGGNVRQSPLHQTAQLIMDNDTDKVLIKGGLLGPVGTAIGASNTGNIPVEFWVTDLAWTKGVLSVNGDVAVRGTGVTSDTVPLTTTLNTHEFVMIGTATQQLRAVTGFGFSALTLNNSSVGGIALADTIITGAARRFRVPTVRRNLTVRDNTLLSGNGRIDVLGDVQTLPGSSIVLAAVKIGSVQRVSGGWTVDTTEFAAVTRAQTIQPLGTYKDLLVTGKAAFGGNISIAGGLTVGSAGELIMAKRSVTVNGASSIAGIVRMQDPKDTLTIDGNLTFLSGAAQPDSSLVTAGVLKVTGNVSGSGAGRFNPSGTHKTIWNSGNLTTLEGNFNDLEVITKVLGVTNTPTILNANIHGRLIANSGQARLIIAGNVVVDGAADLTMTADTVVITGTTTFRSSLKVRMLRVSATLQTVNTKDFEIVDGGSVNGQVLYSGRYTEGLSLANQSFNLSTLATVTTVDWKGVPATAQAGTAFNVELLPKSGTTLLTGTAILTITASSGNVNGVASYRVLYTPGTQIPITLSGSGAGMTLRVSIRLPNGSTLAPVNSTAINVAAAP
ncbi:MAG TPA: Ig-like domain-containing protein [Gemmatimonadaceae bacterium]|nr:Ig-like domain-containing protein [Gemmatimonadaceae bacterium]